MSAREVGYSIATVRFTTWNTIMGRFRWLTFAILTTFVLSTLIAAGPSHAMEHRSVGASYWIIYDVTNDRVLANERMNERVPIASLTKMMTALLAVEHLSMDDEITIVKEDQVGEASIWAEEDDVLTARTLLYGLMMRSANDAAAALARAVGGSPDEESAEARAVFTSMMNIRAQKLGMKDTRFSNPHGLDQEDHYSSAYDLMLLTKEAMSHPEFMRAFGADLWSGDGFHFGHTNQLPDMYDGVLGGKTGWTDNAGLCLIEVVEQNGRILIVVLIGSTFERWYPDAIDLFDYGWKLPGIPRSNSIYGPTQWES